MVQTHVILIGGLIWYSSTTFIHSLLKLTPVYLGVGICQTISSSLSFNLFLLLYSIIEENSVFQSLEVSNWFVGSLPWLFCLSMTSIQATKQLVETIGLFTIKSHTAELELTSLVSSQHFIYTHSKMNLLRNLSLKEQLIDLIDLKSFDGLSTSLEWESCYS